MILKKIKSSSFAKHGIVYALGNAINSLLAFFLLPLYLRNLTVEEYGIYGLLLIIIQVVSRFGNLGIESSMLRSSYDYEDAKSKGRVYFTSLAMMLVSLSLIGLVMLLFQKNASQLLFNTNGYESLILLAVAIGSMRALRKLPQSILRIYKRSIQYIFLEIVNFVVGISILIYLIEFRRMGLDGLMIGTFYSMIFNTLIFALVVFKYYSFGVLKNEIVKQIRFGLPMIPAAVASLLFLASGRFILEEYHSLEAVGIFTLSVQLAGMLETFFGGPVKLSWQPYYLENYKKENSKQNFGKIINGVAGVSLILSVSMAYFAEPLFTIFAKPKYLQAIRYLPYLLMLYSFWTLVPIYNGGVIATRKTSFIMKNFIFGAFVVVIGSLVFIPVWDVAGAIAALGVAYTSMFINIQWYNSKLGHSYVDWNRHWWIYGLGFGFLFVSHFLFGISGITSFLVRIGAVSLFIFIILKSSKVGLRSAVKAIR